MECGTEDEFEAFKGMDEMEFPSITESDRHAV
jgi:hypothetical protein